MVTSTLALSDGNFYRSTSVIEVRAPGNHISLLGKDAQDAERSAMTDRYWDSQCEIMQSEMNFQRVIERLNLTERWPNKAESMEDMMATLRGAVEVHRIEDTDLFRITVRLPNPQNARDVAHAIGIAYKERRESDHRKILKTHLEALQNEVRSQEDLVLEKRKLFETIARAVGTPYFRDQPESQLGTAESELLLEAQREHGKLKLKLALAEGELKAVRELEGEDLFAYLATQFPDSPTAQAQQKFQAKKADLEADQERLGAEHPTVLAIKENLDALSKLRTRHAEEIFNQLTASLKVLKARTDAALGYLHQLNRDVVDKALQSNEYVDAKNEYELATQLLDELLRESHEQRIAVRTPLFPIVIHEEPRMAKAPDRRDLRKSVRVGAILGAALGLILALIVRPFTRRAS